MFLRTSFPIYIFLIQMILYITCVSGDKPLETLLSTLECFKTHQVGCYQDFTDAYPQLSRSFDNLSRAATRFYLFTPKNPRDPELMHKCAGKPPPNSNFNPKCKTIIVFPGFFSGICHFAIYKELVYQRMKCGCYNYIHVEWTWGNSFDFISSIENAKIVAKQIGVVIRNLKEMYGLKLEDFLCVGHSLGSQGCLFVEHEEKIGAIHALDPGNPFTQNSSMDMKLDPTDAPCIQVMHSKSTECLISTVSPSYTLGTKNFYFNDGANQPSCIPQIFISLLKGDLIYALLSLYPPFCNHLHSLQYYKTSICSPDCKWVGVECEDYESFKSGKCNDCGPNGEKCDITGFDSCECGRGNFKKYYLKTKLFCPYCDDEGIKNLDRFKCSPQHKSSFTPNSERRRAHTSRLTHNSRRCSSKSLGKN